MKRKHPFAVATSIAFLSATPLLATTDEPLAPAKSTTLPQAVAPLDAESDEPFVSPSVDQFFDAPLMRGPVEGGAARERSSDGPILEAPLSDDLFREPPALSPSQQRSLRVPLVGPEQETAPLPFQGYREPPVHEHDSAHVEPEAYSELDRLQHDGPRLGVVGRMIDGRGFGILEVVPGSVAAGMRLERGDIITAINGQSIDSMEDIFCELSNSMQYYRGVGILEIDNVRHRHASCHSSNSLRFQKLRFVLR